MVGTRKSLPSLALPDDVPAELRIDGKSTLLGEKRDEAPKRVYYWKGAVYEATTDTPAEWLTQEPERKRRKPSPSPCSSAPSPPPPPTPPPKMKTRARTTATSVAKKKAKSTATATATVTSATATRAEHALAHDLDVTRAAAMKAEVEKKKQQAQKNGFCVQGLQDDEVRDNVTVSPPDGRRQDEIHDDAPPTSILLLQNIHVMSKLNSRIDRVKARYGKMKGNGLSAEALRKRKRALEESELGDTVPGRSSAKRARQGVPEEEHITPIDGLTHIPTPDETDQHSFLAQLQAAANAAPADDQDRRIRSQLERPLRSPRQNTTTPARPAADRSTPPEEPDTSSSEVPPRRHASSVSMSISSGTSPSIHEVATAPATNEDTTDSSNNRSPRPSDHFGSQQPHMAPPELAQKNRGGQALRWSINPEDIAKDPERAESLIRKSRMDGESKQARRRRVAREMDVVRKMSGQGQEG